MKQGQSSATLIKEVEIQTCLHWRLSATKPSRFFVFDLNCGSGENRSNGANCLGTGPLVRNALQKRGITGRMWLCDINRHALWKAEEHFFSRQGRLFEPFDTSHGITATFIRMDNREFVPTILPRLTEENVNPRFAHGIIIADPNGLKVPVQEIGTCVAEAQMLDVIIHLCGLKQVAACRAKHPKNPMMNLGPSVVTSCSAIFRMIPKRTWLITQPFRGNSGRDHIVFYGTNLRHDRATVTLPGRPELYRHDSMKGRAVIADIERFSLEVA